MSLEDHEDRYLWRPHHLEGYLHKGETFMGCDNEDDEQNYQKALGWLKKAILFCDCNKSIREAAKHYSIVVKDLPIPVCHCKDYLSLSPSDGQASQAIYSLATAPCSCGSGIKPCHHPVHLKALINVTTIHEKDQSYKLALQFASMIITLAPHAPEGYLKMAKILRLRTLTQHTNPASICNWLYKQGAHNIRAHGDQGSRLSKALGLLIRRDIIQAVPVEVAILILGHLSRGDLCCRAMQVSKCWKERCRHKSLWWHLAFVRNPRLSPLRQRLFPGVLNDVVLKRSQQVATSLTLHGLWDFAITGAQFQGLLKALPRLRTLDVAGHRAAITTPPPKYSFSTASPLFADMWKIVCNHAPSTLTSVSLAGFDQPPAKGYLGVPFLTSSYEWLVGTKLAQSLESLALRNMASEDMELVLMGTVCRNKFSNLKTLSILYQFNVREGPIQPRPFISLPGLTRCAPELKDILMDVPQYQHSFDFFPDFLMEAEKTEDSSPYWEGLRRLRLVGPTSTPSEPHSHSVPLSNTLRAIELEKRNVGHDLGLLIALPSHGLEHFRCHYDRFALNGLSHPNQAMGLMPSITAGNLRSLDLTFTDSFRNQLDEVFMQQKGILHTLSCYGLEMHRGEGQSGNWERCLEWISTFPNLQVVGLYPEALDENPWMVITRLMKLRPDIKTIYTNVLRGTYRDEILALAANRGVTIVEADRVPEPELHFPPPPPYVNSFREREHEAEADYSSDGRSPSRSPGRGPGDSEFDADPESE